MEEVMPEPLNGEVYITMPCARVIRNRAIINALVAGVSVAIATYLYQKDITKETFKHVEAMYYTNGEG
jgi:hypothetical protein